jgi:3-oxoacyl-(acyl-carrier-protein) synthase
MERGQVGLTPLTLFASPRYGQVLTGEVQQDLAALGAPRRSSRSDKLGWLAAREALHQAQLPRDALGERAGVVIGASVGGSYDSEQFLVTLMKRGKMRTASTRHHGCMHTVDLIANDFGLLGPSMAIATACSSGSLALGTAAELIESGEADIILAGGADSLCRMTWGGFHSLLLVDGQGCRPFDAGRGGMSLGEGAGMLVLEAEENALARGANILARLTGWGASCDAHHATAPHPEGAGALIAMRAALQRAGLVPDAINYVNAHGTGTRDNDAAESKALKALFGARVPAVSSTKRFFGHALAASGAIEAVVCVEALRRQLLPPNPGFATPDPALGITPVTTMTSAPLRHVMSNSFGFGGNNAVVVLSAPDTNVAPRFEPKPGRIAVTGLGVIGPGERKTFVTAAPLPVDEVPAVTIAAMPTEKLTPLQRRRTSRQIQMTLLAAKESIVQAAPISDVARGAIAIGTGLGGLEAGSVFLENMVGKDEREPMPAQFPISVHNAPAGQVAMDLGWRGLNSAPTAGDITFECALWQVLSQLRNGDADTGLVGAVDEVNKYALAVGKRWGVWTPQTLMGEGCVVARVQQAEAAGALAHVTAVRLGRWRGPFDPEREAEWIARSVDVSGLGVVVTGAKGFPQLDPRYTEVLLALSRRAGRELEHSTFKQHTGEFLSASAFGFAQAVRLSAERRCSVLLFTLGLRGTKALCCVEP